jgi:hypothetical protein
MDGWIFNIKEKIVECCVLVESDSTLNIFTLLLLTYVDDWLVCSYNFHCKHKFNIIYGNCLYVVSVVITELFMCTYKTQCHWSKERSNEFTSKEYYSKSSNVYY